MAGAATAFEAEELAISQISESAIRITAEANSVTAVHLKDIVPICAAPRIPPAVITAQTTPTESREMGVGVALWAVQVAASMSALRLQTETLALPELVEAAVVVAAHVTVEAASFSTAKPVPEASSIASTDPAMVAAASELTQVGEISLTLAFHLTLA